MEKHWVELDQDRYEYVNYLTNRKILIDGKILLYSKPEFEQVTETVKKRFGGTKQVTKRYLKSIRIVNCDLDENTMYNGYGSLEFVDQLMKYYNVETLRKKYLSLERQFKMFQQFENKQIEKESINAKSL